MAAKLVSMKTTAAERKKREESYKACMPYDGDVFPYGLRIELSNDALEKLGLDSLPKTGKKVSVVCECSVTSTSENQTSHEGKVRKDRRLSLQIEKIALDIQDGGVGEAVDEALEDLKS